MKTVELCAGRKSFSKYAEKLGCETFTVDNEERLNPDYVGDLLYLDSNEIIWEKIKNADIVWMSPPCTTFSMASGNTHWTADRQPKTTNAKIGKELLEVCKDVAKYCEDNGKLWFIENPRARMRWFMPENNRHTVWYCQYGHNNAKPTDIWTNLRSWVPKTCKNGNKECHHEPAPRGSKTGTQGLKGATARGVIPELLFKEIFEVINKND